MKTEEWIEKIANENMIKGITRMFDPNLKASKQFGVYKYIPIDTKDEELDETIAKTFAEMIKELIDNVDDVGMIPEMNSLVLTYVDDKKAGEPFITDITGKIQKAIMALKIMAYER